MPNNPISDEKLLNIFKKSGRNSELIGTNEGITIEYKQSFGWKSVTEYFKAMAAFANRDGGYLIFGVKDKPHLLFGLESVALKNFEAIDNGQWTTNLREYFSPEINWEKSTFVFDDKTYGIIYTYPAFNKPVICKKTSGELRKAAIYYRYNSQNSEIEYPELQSIIEGEKQKINELWIKKMRQISEIGVSKLALLDLENGSLSGANTTLYIDEPLLNEIKFVQEGSFVETGGNPALKVVGEVKTVVGARKVVVEKPQIKAINSDEIIRSFITQENVNNPMEFVRQICYQNTGNLPVYYFMKLAGQNAADTVEFLDNVPTSSQSKDILRRRIKDGEKKFVKLSVTSSDASKKKQSYYKAFLDDNILIPTSDNELKYFLAVIRSLSAEDIVKHKDRLLNALYEIYINYYNSPEHSIIKNEFRYALCWIDEALYMD